MENFKRNNSVCADPKEDLLRAVLENRQFDIERIAKNNRGILYERYGGKYLKPILFIAIKDKADVVTTNTVKRLIELGAPLIPDPNDQTWHGFEAIHFASLGLNPSILECIIKHYNENSMNINSVSKNGSTALHVLIKEGDANHVGFEKCVKILLKEGIDYNKTDERHSPPIYWAAKKGYKNIVTILLSCYNVDIDTYKFRNKCTRDLINDLEIPIQLDNVGDNNNSVAEELLSFVKRGMEDEFIALGETVVDVGEFDGDERSFLQYACEKNLVKVVEYLLGRGVDVNKVSAKHPESPVEIAANHGFYLILQALLSKSDAYVSDDVLLKVMPKLDYEPTRRSDYLKCFEALMGCNKQINVNRKDKMGNYPLHYGARYGGPEIALKLLNKKASLANRNAFNYLNINEIDYNTLKQHFDECIEAVPDNKLDKESMIITFDYETLLPTKTELRMPEYDEEKNLCKKKSCATPETDALLFMSKSSELKTLLKHPLITSFLYVKWYRIRWIFYANLIFYLAFLLSLLLYIFAYYKEPNHARNSFIFVFLLLTTLLLLVREMFQILVGPAKYFSNFENFIEITLIGITGFMLLAKDPSAGVRTQTAAFAFLLAAFELLFLLGNYPGLSTNIVMLRTVSLNFFKFLLFYSILIIAFAFCFHTLFQNNHHGASGANATALVEQEEEDDRFFVNPLISMFKTIIMLTGEFEAGEIKFEYYPITSHLIFLAFVITIAIILLNLLNGLAVSDTQEIKNEAELVGHITRAEYIAYAESMIFSSLIPHKITSAYHTIFPCQNQNNFKRCLSKPLAEKICIYPEYLRGFKLVIYPNQNGRVHFENEVDGSCKCRNLHLDKVTVRRARALLQEKKEREKEERDRKRLSDMQQEILKKVNELMEKIGN